MYRWELLPAYRERDYDDTDDDWMQEGCREREELRKEFFAKTFPHERKTYMSTTNKVEDPERPACFGQCAYPDEVCAYCIYLDACDIQTELQRFSGLPD